MGNKFGLPAPVNEVQRRFLDLCEKGGGVKGGPPRTRVQKLLRTGGKLLNERAFEEIADALAANPGADPWKVCFAVALCWGHLAQTRAEFVAAAVRCLEHWNDVDLKEAMKYPLEKGPSVIEQSLRGGYVMFSKVRLSATLPTTLAEMRRAQDRWNIVVANKEERPAYIAYWNCCAMFMVALFANPSLADQLFGTEIGLPIGGPIHGALSILHKCGVIAQEPSAKSRNDTEFDLSLIYTTTGLMAELLKGLPDWTMLDVHSGLYMLGSRLPESDMWIDWTKADWS